MDACDHTFFYHSVIPPTHCLKCGRCLGCGQGASRPIYPQPYVPSPYIPTNPWPYRPTYATCTTYTTNTTNATGGLYQ